jgi:hypothetical protein
MAETVRGVVFTAAFLISFVGLIFFAFPAAFGLAKRKQSPEPFRENIVRDFRDIQTV